MLTEKERNWLVIWTEYASKPGPLQAKAARIADELATRTRREGGADTAVIRAAEAEAGVRGELPDESGRSLPLFPA
jgi:hypothetical protein